MKKISFMLCAAALMLASTFTSCSKEDNSIYPDNIVIRNGYSLDSIYAQALEKAKGDEITIQLPAGVEVFMKGDIEIANGMNLTIVGDAAKPATVKAKGGFIATNGITLKNVVFDAKNITTNFITLKGSETKAMKTTGEIVDGFVQYGDINLIGVKIDSLTHSLVRCGETARINSINVENSIININGTPYVFGLGSAFYDSFSIDKSTFYSITETGHTAYFIKSDGKPNNLEKVKDQVFYKEKKDEEGKVKIDTIKGQECYPKTIVTSITNSTIYKVSKDSYIANSNGNMKGQYFLKQILKNNILVYFGNKGGATSRGWMFGQNSDRPYMEYANNTYWTDKSEAANWKSGTGGDISETIIDADPSFVNPAEANFKPTGGQAGKNGDPRWW